MVISVYTIFEDKKWKGVNQKIGQAKNCKKTTKTTNIIATDFVWEQKKINNAKFLSRPGHDLN